MMTLEEQKEVIKQYRKMVYNRDYNKQKHDELNEKARLRMTEYRKKPETKLYQDEYQRKVRARRSQDPAYREYMRNYNRAYAQRPEVKARRQLSAARKWMEHRMRKDGDTSPVRRRAYYKFEAYCSGCEVAYLKPILRCPQCTYLLKQGPTKKKDVHRY